MCKHLTNKVKNRPNNYPSKQPNKQPSVYKKQPVVSTLLKKLPCSVQCFTSPYPGPDKPNPRPLLVPKPIFISVPTARATWTFHFIPLYFIRQYNSVSSTYYKAFFLHNIFQPSVIPFSLCLKFPQPPHNNKHFVRKPEFKTSRLKMPVFCLFQNDFWFWDMLMGLFLWSDHSEGALILKKLLHSLQRFYRKLNLQNFTYWINCGSNCIARNVARFWRIWRVTE